MFSSAFEFDEAGITRYHGAEMVREGGGDVADAGADVVGEGPAGAMGGMVGPEKGIE